MARPGGGPTLGTVTRALQDHTRAPEGYEVEGHDEAFEADGSARPPYAELVAALSEADLRGLAGGLSHHMRDRGVTFAGEAFRVDPVPRIVTGEEWSSLESGLIQRARALAAFVSDVYTDRVIVAAGVVPARVIESAEHFEPWMMGAGTPTGSAGHVAGLDLVRGADGVPSVLEDNFRTPSGLAYLLATREALVAHPPMPAPALLRDPAPAAAALLGACLRDAAPEGVDEPRVVLLSDGPSNCAWHEHGRLAALLDIPVVSPADLSVRAGRLLAHRGGRTERVDVVYRRTDVDRLRDRTGAPTWIAQCLLDPVRRGTLAVVNPLGSGVADDKVVHAYVEEMVRFYLGEEPLIASVRTYDLGDPDVRDEVLPQLGELVLKPRGGLGGEGVVLCPRASREDREQGARRVVEAPGSWVAQELVGLSTHPTVCDGRLRPRHVDLRPFVVGGAERAAVVPGALTRVAFDAGNMVVNSSRNGGAKDTWVLAP